MDCRSKKSAFTLVELSIVLVILGLLTGGVLSGQSLIRAAQLRSAAVDHDRFQAAVHTFRDKYFAIPGDMYNATSFWNANSTYCDDSSGNATETGVCPGDGNGFLDASGVITVTPGGPVSEMMPACPFADPGCHSGAATTAEYFQFWHELALAGMIEGNFTGVSGTVNSNDSVPGTNVPTSKLGNAGWYAYYWGPYAGDGNLYAADYGNVLSVGAISSGDFPQGAALKPEDAWNIDTKMDDGKPGTGTVLAEYWSDACATGGASETDTAHSVYNLVNSSAQCALLFTRQF